MNRHGSSFGSNNCSKRVVISVSIHFLCCGFGRVLRSASTGDAPFWGVPKSPVFSPASPVLGPASPVLGWQIPSFLHFFRFLLHRFCAFLHEFCIFSHFFVKFSACANANWQISGVCLGPHLSPHQGRLDRNESDFVLWSFLSKSFLSFSTFDVFRMI